MREGGREQAMSRHQMTVQVLGPWSLATSRGFWEGFAPSALAQRGNQGELRSVFCAETDWRRAEVVVTQEGDLARLVVTGDGDLEGAAGQVCRFLSLDVDGRGWTEVATRDPVIADAQARPAGAAPVWLPLGIRGGGVVGPVATHPHRPSRPAA